MGCMPPHPARDAARSDDLPSEHCTRFHAAIELLGRRWNGGILEQLLSGPMRFSEIRRAIPRITDAMLSLRLRELEDAGIVQRSVHDQRPVQVKYELTPVGYRLGPVLAAVTQWSNEWAEADNTSTKVSQTD